MTDLADFLLERIGEEERLARTIQARGRWAWREYETIYSLSDDQELSPYFSIDLSRGCVYPTASVMEHIKRQDPTRVLAECEAKRQIVTRYEYASGQVDSHLAWRTGDDGWEKIAGALEYCLESLALPYADHPDYRQEWKP